MGLLDKVSGNKAEDVETQAGEPSRSAEESTQSAQPYGEQPPPRHGIRAFDQDGREVIVPREEWRANVLPNMLKEVWDQRRTSSTSSSSTPSTTASSRTIDRRRPRTSTRPTPSPPAAPACGASCSWETGRLDEAEARSSPALLADNTEKTVPSSPISPRSTLPKGDLEQRADRQPSGVPWRLEPNLDNGLGWYASMAQEKGGDDAAREVLEKLRAMPQSWRAQLWLARAELTAQNLGLARKLYEEAIERAPKPLPPDFMMQMSGDLGAAGHLGELIQLTAPQFVPAYHGMPVGNNLIKALVDTNNLDAAEQVKTALQEQNRPDWKDALAFWDTELGKRRVATAPDAQQLQVGMLRIDGPIWLPPGAAARSLFSPKSPSAPKVTFLGGSAESPEAASGSPAPVADDLGRMTRALPLFFAEQVEMRTAAAGRAMIPWAVTPVNGFVVSGQRWPDEAAVQAVQVPENASEYVVSVHVDAEVEPWTAMLAFVRTSDGTRIGELDREFDAANPETGLAELANEVVELLSALGPATPSPAYEVPGPATFGNYLQRLEQLLAVRCASMEGVPPQFLNGEKEILQGELDLCYAEPNNLPARLVLLATQEALGRIKPESAAAFVEPIAKLSEAHPLAV